MFEKRVTDRANDVLMAILEKIDNAVAGNNTVQSLEDMSKAAQRLMWLAETKQETKSEDN